MSDIEVAIIKLLVDDTEMTQKEITEIFGMNMSQTKYYFKKLRDNNVLLRVGARKNGKWVVNEEMLKDE